MRAEFKTTHVAYLILHVVMSPFADNLSSNIFTKLLTSSTLPIRILSNHACETGVENDHRPKKRL
jgi:hypothetical protein